MTKFAYNSAKNMSTSHTCFKLNCGYYFRVSYKKDIDLRSNLKSAVKLSIKFRKLIIICQKNFDNTQELQKQAYDIAIKPQSYTFSNIFWLNNKYIKTQ